MGVTALWSVVQPCARPIKIDTLNKKRLAIDASIWIYHFLKAVRDKEGNQLRNSHIVGFYRRICKLLFFGIKPVFVFDGGAPALKRQTIAGRKQRREGRREDAVRTAGKLLALQMQRRAEEEEQKRREEARRPAPVEEEAIPENLVYVDELQMTEQERQRNRRFKKKDQYHLPELDMPLAEMGAPEDPRVMSMEELEQYARQFDTGEDINLYDFSKIDFDSDFFTSLPATDRYNILNAARLRSRLRMGYSREQLEAMFPDRMAFSKFQIERVRERNELTQRLMQVGTAEEGTFGADNHGRIAGEKGREYVLVKNTGVEGGWALGVIGERDKDEGERTKPIDVDNLQEDEDRDASDSADGEANFGNQLTSDEVLKRREAFYRSRRREIQTTARNEDNVAEEENDDSLFVGQDRGEYFSNLQDESSSDSEDNDAQMQIALALSLEGKNADEAAMRTQSKETSKRGERFDMSSINKRSQQMAIQPPPRAPATAHEDSSSDEEMDLEALLTTSQPPKGQLDNAPSQPEPKPEPPKVDLPGRAKFDGPLPFEKLNLGSSILGKRKKAPDPEPGGFERETEQKQKRQETRAASPPPWFSSDVSKGIEAQRAWNREEEEKRKEEDERSDYEFMQQPILRGQRAPEVIDVDATTDKNAPVIDLDSDLEDESRAPTSDNAVIQDPKVRMGDLADQIRAEPPKGSEQEQLQEVAQAEQSKESAEASHRSPKPVPQDNSGKSEAAEAAIKANESERKQLGAEKSGDENTEEPLKAAAKSAAVPPRPSPSDTSSTTRSESPEVYMPTEADLIAMDRKSPSTDNLHSHEPSEAVPMSGNADQNMRAEEHEFHDSDVYSDSEDEELMEQLTVEAEEHARFASSLNNRTTQQNMDEYERELKALRNQQKKDRRDADEVTQVMIAECQQLLKLFGLPYITAPMEAEAQCAELVSLGLVDGIVTDDSDIFLFGGTRVYKNMFNQAKFVECYLASDLERDYDLTRQKLINVAHLLGSDYTEGLQGIGPVTALEIVTEFPESLEAFKEWWSAAQMGGPPSEEDQASPFRKKFRKNTAKIFLPHSFPDKRVDAAYLAPEVDSDPSAFQWGVPDLPSLRSYLMATIGWTPERTDEVLVPVIRDMNRRENEGTQANITAFIGGNVGVGAGAFAPRIRGQGKSRRMEVALEKMADRARTKRQGRGKDGEGGREEEEEEEEESELPHAADAVIASAGSAVEGTAGAPSLGKRSRNVANGTLDDENDNDKSEQIARRPAGQTKSRRGKKRQAT